MSPPFTLKSYAKILDTFIASDIPTSTVEEYIRRKEPDQSVAVLRHDVDRRPDRALEMAQLESKKGIKATYYFRLCKASFAPATIQQISNLGHEIGYHYEALSLASGNFDLAAEIMMRDIRTLSGLAPIHTASMHGRPFSRWNNSDIWKKYRPSDFGLLGEAYQSIDYSKIEYLNDTGRTWHATRFNIRDHVKSSDANAIQPDSNKDLIKYIEKKAHEKLMMCLSAHPERWPKRLPGLATSWATDQIINLAKHILMLTRR